MSASWNSQGQCFIIKKRDNQTELEADYTNIIHWYYSDYVKYPYFSIELFYILCRLNSPRDGFIWT